MITTSLHHSSLDLSLSHTHTHTHKETMGGMKNYHIDKWKSDTRAESFLFLFHLYTHTRTQQKKTKKKQKQKTSDKRTDAENKDSSRRGWRHKTCTLQTEGGAVNKFDRHGARCWFFVFLFFFFCFWSVVVAVVLLCKLWNAHVETETDRAKANSTHTLIEWREKESEKR